MGRCYCTEISTCKYRISKLNDNLTIIDQCEGHMRTINLSLEQLVTHNEQCYDAANMSFINNYIRNLQSSLVLERNKLKDKINIKIQKLKSDLADMIKNDEAYHEAEDPEYEG